MGWGDGVEDGEDGVGVEELAVNLPRLLPLAVEWAETRSREILDTGVPLTPHEVELACAVGVEHPERVRVKVVSAAPLPENPELRAVALQAESMGPSTDGLTLGYGIYLVVGFVDDRLMRHESRHVYQYERAGSIDAFLAKYVPGVINLKYWNAPDEVDAPAWENG
jgi:hypothetical protein